MKLMSFRNAGGVASWGVADGDTVQDLGDRAPSLRAALAKGVSFDTAGAKTMTLSEFTFLPPITDPDKIICVGLNYTTFT